MKKNFFAAFRLHRPPEPRHKPAQNKKRDLAREQRLAELVIKLADPEDFRVYPKESKLYLMDTVIDTTTQYIFSVYDRDSDVEYILGKYLDEGEAERVRIHTVLTRELPAYHIPTLRELAEKQQEVA